MSDELEPEPEKKPTPLIEIARWYVYHGISVIPVHVPKTTAEANRYNKAPIRNEWPEFAFRLPTDNELVRDFDSGREVAIGMVPGPASGNMVVLDFENKESNAYDQWFSLLPDELRELVQTLPTVRTPSGGVHLWIRLENPHPVRSTKLARYASGVTKIEVKGTGGQVLAPGSPKDAHWSSKSKGKPLEKTGVAYTWHNGVEPTDFVEVDDDTWLTLVDYAGKCNEYTQPELARDYDRKGTPAGEDSPGNDFNRRGSWEETGLFDAGWKWVKCVGSDTGYITRPGKDSGVSASLGMISSQTSGYPYLYVWSTSTDFPSESPMSRFAVYARLKHSGDYKEAAKELARQGYGERREFTSPADHIDLSGYVGKLEVRHADPTDVVTIPPDNENGVPNRPIVLDIDMEPDRIFKWVEELEKQADDARWMWRGYLARGHITLFSALWKSGKTTLLKHLIKSFGGDVAEFLGQPICPTRVLVITEESADLWAGRRDELGYANRNVGIILNPFKVRSTMKEWNGFLIQVANAVARYQFDVVIFDTISKMWPVREENDAGQTEEAMMPLKYLTEAGAAVMVVHHSRKSQGDQFEGARGSGGISATPDILVEFRRYSPRPKETKRVIRATGRWEHITPEEIVIELLGNTYVSHGDSETGAGATTGLAEIAEQAEKQIEKKVDRKKTKEEWNCTLLRLMSELGDWKDSVEWHQLLTETGTKISLSSVSLFLRQRHTGGELKMRTDGNKYFYKIEDMKQEEEDSDGDEDESDENSV